MLIDSVVTSDMLVHALQHRFANMSRVIVDGQLLAEKVHLRATVHKRVLEPALSVCPHCGAVNNSCRCCLQTAKTVLEVSTAY